MNRYTHRSKKEFEGSFVNFYPAVVCLLLKVIVGFFFLLIWGLCWVLYIFILDGVEMSTFCYLCAIYFIDRNDAVNKKNYNNYNFSE